MVVALVALLVGTAYAIWHFVPEVHSRGVWAPNIFASVIELAVGLILVNMILAAQEHARKVSAVGYALVGPVFAITMELALVTKAFAEAESKGRSSLRKMTVRLRKTAASIREVRETYVSVLEAESIALCVLIAEHLERLERFAELPDESEPDDDAIVSWHRLYGFHYSATEILRAIKRLPLRAKERRKYGPFWRGTSRWLRAIERDYGLNDSKTLQQWLALYQMKSVCEDISKE